MKLFEWRITRIRVTPARLIGYVQAAGGEEVVKEAIVRYWISNPQQQARLTAQRVKEICKGGCTKLSPTEAGLKLPMSLMPIRAPQPSRGQRGRSNGPEARGAEGQSRCAPFPSRVSPHGGRAPLAGSLAIHCGRPKARQRSELKRSASTV